MEQPQEKLISEVRADEAAFLKQKVSEYTSQGVSDVEAMQQAAAEWKSLEEERDKQGEALWDEVTKKVGLCDFLDDQIRRALGVYKYKWDKANAPEEIDFKMELKSLGGLQGRMIAGAQLRLEIKRGGLWRLWRNKEIKFEHIREARATHKWKLALYEAMYQDLLSWGVTYCILCEDFKDGRIKIEPNGARPEQPTE